MKFYTDLENTFDNGEDWSAESTDVTMFNNNNELTILMDTNLPEMEGVHFYVDGKKYGSNVSSLTYMYTILKSFGFGENYDVTWSYYSCTDENGLQYGIIEMNL
jgi:hypothetical protein